MIRSLAIAGAVLVVAGCGGGGGEDRLSKAEFVSQADAICRSYEAKLDALGTPQNQEQLTAFADKAVPIAKQGREDLGKLNPPEALEDRYDGWLEQGDKAIEIVEDLRDAAKERDTARIQEIAKEAAATDREANRLAAELGFQQCGSADRATS